MEITLSRDAFLDRFRNEWKLDQHVSLIGPTGRGKSYTARQILSNRPGQILILAPKGVDKTMAGFGEHISKWPPGLFVNGPDETGRWVLRLEPRVKKPEDLGAMRVHFAKAMRDVFRKHNWTLYVDELQVIADPRMMGLGKLVEANLLMGRSRNISVVSSIQVPRWAPRAAYDQASHVLMWRQRDRQALNRIGEISGVDTYRVRIVVQDLDFHEFLWVDATKDKLYRVLP